MIAPAPGSFAEANCALPPVPRMSHEETRAALTQALLVISYMSVNLERRYKRGTVGRLLSKLGFTYLDRMPSLARLAVFTNKEFPKL